MFGELITINCGGCARPISTKDSWNAVLSGDIIRAHVLGSIEGSGALVFGSHSSAIRVGQACGWILTSENLSGDLCPDCQPKEVDGPGELTAAELEAEEYDPRDQEFYDSEFESHLEAEAELDELFPAGPWGLAENPESDRADEDDRAYHGLTASLVPTAPPKQRPKQHLRCGEHAELKDVRDVWRDQGITTNAEYKFGAYRWRVVAGHIHGRGFESMSELEYDTEQKALDAAYNYGRERCAPR